MLRRLGCWLVLCLWASGAGATGVLELINGDRLRGDFVKIEEDKLYWHSPELGEVSVDVHRVQELSTTVPLKVDGTETPCLVEGMDNEHLVYRCGGDPEERRAPLAALDPLQPYEEHVEGEYSYQGRLSITGLYSRGNEVRDDWKLNSQVTYRRADFRHSVSAAYASYSVNKKPSDLKWGGRYTLDWFFREQWFWYNDVSLGRDEVRGVGEYYTAGSGVGHQFWESRETALSITTGLTYVNERYQVPSEPPVDFERQNKRTAWRLGSDFRFRLPLGISLFHKNEYIQSVENGSDWQLSSNTGLSTMLVGQMYSEFKIDYNIDNDPQQDKSREDKRLTVGVSYEW